MEGIGLNFLAMNKYEIALRTLLCANEIRVQLGRLFLPPSKKKLQQQ